MNKNSSPADTVSVVIPVQNEEDNITFMADGIHEAMGDWSYEMIFVDDGSTDDTVSRLQSLARKYPELRCIKHKRQCGQSAAIRTGIQRASGTIIATLDGDGQNPPIEIRNLVTHLLSHEGRISLVQGQRENRQDTLWKKCGSRFANRLRQRLLKDGVQDSGCGLKAFYRDAYLSLAFFDHLHRFMPAMMIREGFDIDVLPVTHSPRKAGVSKYGNLDRAFVGIWDLLGVIWLLRRRRFSEIEEIISKVDYDDSEILDFEDHFSNAS